MSSRSVESALRKHRFVQHLDPEHLQILLGCARYCKFPEGASLKRQGDLADELYLLHCGEVALEISVPHNGALQVEILHGGGVLGWSCLVEPYRWRFDARALSPVTAVALNTSCLRQKCESDPAFGYQILSRCTTIIAHRLEALQRKLLELQGSGRL